MKDEHGVKEQPVNKHTKLRRRIAELEDALDRSEERWQFVLEGSGGGIWDRNVQTNEVFYSRRWKEVLGYKEHEIKNEREEWIKRIHPDDREAVLEEVEKHARGEIPQYIVEHRMLCKDGKYKWVRSRGKVVEWTEDGGPLRFVGMHTDITKQKLAEIALRESEEKYRNIFDNSLDAIYIHDFEGKFLDANQAALDLLGYTREEICTLHFASLLDEKQVSRAFDAISNLLAGEHSTQEYVMVGKDGKSIYIEVLGSVVYDKDGKPSAIQGIARNVTERKETEEALIESEEKYHSLYSSMTEGVCLHEIIYNESGKAVDYRILDVNPSYERILGLSREETVGSIASEFYGSDDPPYIGIYTKVVESGQPTAFETYFPPMDRHFSISVFSPRKGQFATIFSDITERKRLEKEFLKIQKLESIGILAGGIAHDLNNLLTGVIGNISLARTYDNPADKDRRLIEAEKASMHIRDLTQQLLTFSKGGAPILQSANIRNLLMDSATFVLRGSSVRCEFSIPDDLPPVKVDEGQMNQVINNIVINAEQSMPDGGLIKICAQRLAINAEDALPLEAGDYVRISIADHGVGIPKEYLQRVFDPYFTTKQKGSGLGLATSYSIVQKHNGHMTVESQMGVGTTFHIYLPASPKEIIIEKGKLGEKPIMGEGRVLVMDDDDMVRELISDMLSDLGYEAATARDGTESIDLYKRAMKSGNAFDAVIMDLTIRGGMGGKDAIQKLKEIDPEIKAIVSSGYSTDPIMSNFREYGFVGVIAKPYKNKELSELLYEVISKNA